MNQTSLVDLLKNRFSNPAGEEEELERLRRGINKPLPPVEDSPGPFSDAMLKSFSRSADAAGTITGPVQESGFTKFIDDRAAEGAEKDKMRATDEAMRRKELLSRYSDIQKGREGREKNLADIGMKEMELGEKSQAREYDREQRELDRGSRERAAKLRSGGKEPTGPYAEDLNAEKGLPSFAKAEVSEIAKQVAHGEGFKTSIKEKLNTVNDLLAQGKEEEARRQSLNMLKEVNSMISSDAIQAADRELLSPELERSLENVLRTGKITDVGGWVKKVDRSLQALDRSNERNRGRIKDIYSGGYFKQSYDNAKTPDLQQPSGKKSYREEVYGGKRYRVYDDGSADEI